MIIFGSDFAVKKQPIATGFGSVDRQGLVQRASRCLWIISGERDRLEPSAGKANRTFVLGFDFILLSALISHRHFSIVLVLLLFVHCIIVLYFYILLCVYIFFTA